MVRLHLRRRGIQVLAAVGALLASVDYGSAQSSRPDSSWIGQTVVKTTPKVQLRAFNKTTGRTEVVGDMVTLDARVDHIQGDWVWVRTLDQEGWVQTSDVVLSTQAVPYFTRRIQADPQDAFAFSQRAGAWLDKGEPENAHADMSEALRLNPTDANTWHNRGVVRQSLGQYDRAIADYNEAMRLEADQPLYYNHRGESRHFLRDYDRAIADYTEAIRLLPGYATAYSNRGWAWREKQELEIALSDFEQALKLDSELIGAYRGRGMIQYLKGNYAEAIASYDQVLSRDPSQTVYYNDRGWARLKLNQVDQALADFDEALRQNPEMALAVQGRSISHYRRGDYTAALQDCREVIRLAPDLEYAYHNLGDTLLQLHDDVGAIAALTQAIQTSPQSADNYVLRSRAYRNQRDLAKAVADATEALRIDPNSADAYRERAFAFRFLGDYERALADHDETLRRAPNSASDYVFRGNTRFFQGAYDLALRDFTEAVRLDPNDGRAYRHRAMLYACAGNPDFLDLELAEEQLQLTRERMVQGPELAEAEAIVAAARGDFDAAIRFQEEVLADARYAVNPLNQQRMALFREHRPYIQEIPAADALAHNTLRLAPPPVTVPGLPDSATAESPAAAAIPGWGTPVDPLGDCEIALAAGTLTIRAPGGFRDLFTQTAPPPRTNFNAPRVLQPVAGDFAAQVRLRRFPLPTPKSFASQEAPYSFMSGGLVIWQDPQNFIRWQRTANGDSRRTTVLGQGFANGQRVAETFIPLPDEDVWLRVERQVGRFTLQHSPDGNTWTPLVPKGEELKLNENVQVGVFTINVTTREVTHEFTDFQLTTANAANLAPALTTDESLNAPPP